MARTARTFTVLEDQPRADRYDVTIRTFATYEAAETLSGEPTSYWWLSFVDPERPEGQRHLGCTVVVAADMHEAIRASHRLGVNPGGEVAGQGLIDDGTVNADHLAFMLNTLRTNEQMKAQGVI